MRKDLIKISRSLGEKIDKGKKVVIFGHVNPDGDAIGSTLGLYHYLKTRVTEVTVIVPNNFPDFLKWMPDNEKILRFDSQTKQSEELILKADLVFYCDFNDPKRVEKMDEVAKLAKGIKIMIDHHPDPVDFADYIISDTSVSSTAELIYEFISIIEGKTIIGKEIANCLLTGIITDTGMFNHNSENQRTFEIVAGLLSMGADKKLIIQKIYNEYPFDRMLLLGNALHNRFKFYPEFASSFIYLSKEELKKYNHQMGDTEGFVNIALSVAGAKFSALFIEKNDHVKISLRSNGQFDVNQFARKYYNGGGHKNASGGKSFETLNNTIDLFVKLIETHKEEIIAS
jgi:bifunctional oligoribonuclease and PAP phosphatase NrnA